MGAKAVRAANTTDRCFQMSKAAITVMIPKSRAAAR